MSDLQKKLGLKIREFRLKRGLSQEDMAFKASLHRTYISDIERGSRNISIKSIEKIALALDVKPSELFDFDNK